MIKDCWRILKILLRISNIYSFEKIYHDIDFLVVLCVTDCAKQVS